MESQRLTRRRALQILAALTVGPAAACGPGPEPDDDPWTLPAELPKVAGGTDADDVRALMDVLLPAETDAEGRLLSPGAGDVYAFSILQLDHYIPLAQGQGLLPPLPDTLLGDAMALDAFLVSGLAGELNRWAADLRPFSRFADLSAADQITLVDDAFDDPERRPVVEFVRGVCFLAYLGAVKNDKGLVEVGYPPFENFDDGLAVSGYPRTPQGRLIDAETEDLTELAALGQLDDYTYNLNPPPPADDLSSLLTPGGDLL